MNTTPDAHPPKKRMPIPTNRRVKNIPKKPAPASREKFRERSESETNWPASKTELRELNELAPYPRNPRLHDEDQIEKIMASIKQWGFTIPLLIDEAGQLIAGHARFEAAKRLALQRVPVMVARGWTEAQKRAYVIADNQLASLSSWDRESLAHHMQLIDDATLTAALGFNDSELRDLCSVDDLMGESHSGNADVGGSRFLLLLEFDDEPTLQQHFDELRGRGVRVKVMS
jgi:hypothetical protein